MPKAKAIAVAITAENPFALAADSFANFCSLVFNTLYGTPERVRRTMVFTLMLALAGGILSAGDPGILMNCYPPLQ